MRPSYELDVLFFETHAGELDAIFEDDVLRHWDDMEQSGNKVEEEGNERLPLLCYTEEEKEVSSNTKVVVRAAGQQVRSSEEPVLTFELVSQYFGAACTKALVHEIRVVFGFLN